MLKIRSLLFGLFSSVTLFLLLLFVEAFATDKLGKMNEPLLSNFSYIFMLLSVFIGGFLAALSAKGRGLICGAIIAGTWLVLTVVISLIMGTEDLLPIIVRAIGLLPAGIIGGGVGILVSNKNEYV